MTPLQGLPPSYVGARFIAPFSSGHETVLPAWAAVPPETVATIDKMLATSYPATEPGAAVLVVKDGDVLLRKGYGLANLELSVPIRVR